MGKEQDTNKAEKPKKKPIIWIIIGVVVALIIIGIATSGGGDSDKKGVSTKETVQGDKSKKSDNSSKDDESEGPKDTYKKGEVCKTDDIKISFLDCGIFKDYESYAAPEKGKKIIYAEFEIENISDTDQVIDNFDCYADETECDEYYWSGDDVLTFTSLSKGRKAKGKVFFTVPKKAKSIELEYECNWLTSDKIIFVVK